MSSSSNPRRNVPHSPSLPATATGSTSDKTTTNDDLLPLYGGRYLPGKVLGSGTFSVVRLATDSVSRRSVALKCLSKSKVREWGTSDKVVREIANLRRCSAHPHITRLYAVVGTPTDTVLVLDYVSGGDLHTYVESKKRPLPVDEARCFFQQIVSAVEFMHHKRVAHRDLKLENVLLGGDRRSVKIADFGLSNSVVAGEKMVTPCGSPHYAAPEVISGSPYDGPNADLWSTGVILYGLLTGRLPFHEEKMPEQFRKIRGGIYTVPGSVGRDGREVIRGLLTVGAEERMTLEEVRAHPWFQRGLTDYLKQSPAEVEEEERKIVDEGVVEEVVRLHDGSSSGNNLTRPQKSTRPVTRELVERAIHYEASDGGIDGSLPPPEGSVEEDLLDLRTTYELILDDRHEKRRRASESIADTGKPLRASLSFLSVLRRKPV